jgi:hypothetical protein
VLGAQAVLAWSSVGAPESSSSSHNQNREDLDVYFAIEGPSDICRFGPWEPEGIRVNVMRPVALGSECLDRWITRDPELLAA